MRLHSRLVVLLQAQDRFAAGSGWHFGGFEWGLLTWLGPALRFSCPSCDTQRSRCQLPRVMPGSRLGADHLQMSVRDVKSNEDGSPDEVALLDRQFNVLTAAMVHQIMQNAAGPNSATSDCPEAASY